MNHVFDGLGFSPADILLPEVEDLTKWAVVACDQFTSQPEYWEEAARIAGDAPSSLNLILPESGLGKPGEEEKIRRINETMEAYLSEGIFREYRDALIYVERIQSDGRIRKGLVGKVRLDDYEFTPGNEALIRATEGTVLERIPPRVRVREHAPIELPHVMVLIDDPGRTVIEPLSALKDSMPLLYDFELMLGGGRISGWLVSPERYAAVADALRALAAPELQRMKYGNSGKPILYAVGDGNHSLATAKACSGMSSSPEAGFALVELVNNHDDALSFEPIHRVVFGTSQGELLAALRAAEPSLTEGARDGHVFTLCSGGHKETFTVTAPRFQLAHGTIQAFLDEYVRERGCTVDYIHGEDAVASLSAAQDAVGILLPPMTKEDLFKTVVSDGVLPRKTFSMGHAEDKRYYLEARKIR